MRGDIIGVMRCFFMLMTILGSSALAADPPPEFPRAGVTQGTESARILTPGAGMSIYGSHLGPVPGCAAKADPTLRETLNPRNPYPYLADLSVYPRELCGVQVLIGDKSAGLLFVSDKQINFKIPQDGAESGSVDLRVVWQGQFSASVRFEAGFGKTSISLAQPAYNDMPLWLKVDLVFGLGHVAYPYVTGPAGFGCNQVEVRRNGKLLPMLPGSNWTRYGAGLSGNPCGSYAPLAARSVDVLPLHLLYRFSTPGTYEVRYTLLTQPGSLVSARIRAQSDWTPIVVLPSGPNQRREWLKSMIKRASSADAGETLSDLLPSVLGFPDEASFQIVANSLYSPDASVRRYAMDGLSYWPEDATSEKLFASLRTKAPSEELIRFLLRRPEYRAKHQVEIATACLPYLESDSPMAIGGALAALRWPPPSVNSAVFQALLQAAEHIISHGDAQSASEVLQALAGPASAPILDPRVHALLRRLVDAGTVVAAQPLITFRDPDDLPRLGESLAKPARRDQLPYPPELLYESFGDSARPYLEQALRASPGRFSERDLAVQLMLADDPMGFQWALRAITAKGASRIDIMQALRSRFAELKADDDDAITAFVKAHAGN
jgi:hypothetical protein